MREVCKDEIRKRRLMGWSSVSIEGAPGPAVHPASPHRSLRDCNPIFVVLFLYHDIRTLDFRKPMLPYL